MKHTVLGLLFAVLASAQTATINISVTGLPVGVVHAVGAEWTDTHTGGSIGTLTAPLDAVTAVPVIAMTPAAVSSSQPGAVTPSVAAGTVLSIGGEPCAVTALSPLTCARGTVTAGSPTVPIVPLTAHAAGTQIYMLTYATPWAMLAQQSIMPYITNVIGRRRSLFANVTVTGSAQ